MGYGPLPDDWQKYAGTVARPLHLCYLYGRVSGTERDAGKLPDFSPER
jgi:hypothetical protein